MYENMIVIDRQARESLQMQIRRQLAIGIVSRQFPLNEPLPSIRRLASDLKVSVTTVALAYRSLRADGFVDVQEALGILREPRTCLRIRVTGWKWTGWVPIRR